LCEKVLFSLSDPFKFLPKYPKILSIPSIFFQQNRKSQILFALRAWRLIFGFFFVLLVFCRSSSFFRSTPPMSNRSQNDDLKSSITLSRPATCVVRSTTFKRVRKKRSNHQTHAPFTSSSSSSVSTTATHVYWWS